VRNEDLPRVRNIQRMVETTKHGKKFKNRGTQDSVSKPPALGVPESTMPPKCLVFVSSVTRSWHRHRFGASAGRVRRFCEPLLAITACVMPTAGQNDEPSRNVCQRR
jgi:hypothetical protein